MSQATRPATEQVQVFYLFTGAPDPLRLGALEGLLNDGERERAGRFLYPLHRWQFVAAHALLQNRLQTATGRQRSEMTFGQHGRPQLSPPFGAPPLEFNLSHTDGLVAVAVAYGQAVGVDVEAVNQRTSIHDLAQRFFSPDEARMIAADPREDRSRFFAVWTAKEAILKAVGVGLRAPLDSFSISLSPPRARFHTTDLPSDGWSMEQRTFPEHRISVAVRTEDGGPAPAISFIEVGLDAIDPSALPDRRRAAILSLADAEQ